MAEPNETALPALWRKFLDEVVERTKAEAPEVAAGDPYRALELYLKIEAEAVRLAVTLAHAGIAPLNLLPKAEEIARHLRTRLGLPADPPTLDSLPPAALP